MSTIQKNESLRSSAQHQKVSYSELNDVQLGLLRLFSRPMSLEETMELRTVIVQHLSTKLLTEVDRVVEEKGITEKDYKKHYSQHQRSKIR